VANKNFFYMTGISRENCILTVLKEEGIGIRIVELRANRK